MSKWRKVLWCGVWDVCVCVLSCYWKLLTSVSIISRLKVTGACISWVGVCMPGESDCCCCELSTEASSLLNMDVELLLPPLLSIDWRSWSLESCDMMTFTIWETLCPRLPLLLFILDGSKKVCPVGGREVYLGVSTLCVPLLRSSKRKLICNLRRGKYKVENKERCKRSNRVEFVEPFIATVWYKSIQQR